MTALWCTLVMAASPAPRVLVLLPGAPVEFEGRVVAELRQSGFAPIVERGPTRVAVDELDALAAARDAVAAVALRSGEAELVLMVADRVTGKTVLRRQPAGKADADLLAVKLVELLRASFLELELRDFVPRVEAPSPVEALARAPQREATPGRVTLRAAGGTWVGVGWPTVLPGAGLGADWALRRWVRFEAHGWLTLSPAPATGGSGRAALTVHRFDAGVRLVPFDGRVTAWGGLGLGVEWLHVTGTSGGATSSDTATTWVRPVATARAGVAWHPLAAVSFELELTAAVSPERVDVRLTGTTVGAWPRVSLGASVGVSVALPGT